TCCSVQLGSNIKGNDSISPIPAHLPWTLCLIGVHRLSGKNSLRPLSSSSHENSIHQRHVLHLRLKTLEGQYRPMPLLTHSQPAPPAGDILIHAGDLTSTGTFPELDNVLSWLESQTHQHKVFIAGNHDVGLSAARQAKSNSSHMSLQYIASTYPSLTYLKDSSAELRVSGRVFQIYGSPYTPTQGAWAFQHPRRSDALRERWARIPPLTDILITHGPPFGHLDLVRGTNAGCAELLASVWRTRPKVHVFGHIHAARGVEYVRWDARQEVYESVLRGESGWKGVAWLAWHKALDWLTGWGGVGLGDEGTLMVNAAAVGGWRDRELNGAVVVRV
ncbi:Metallo-dependent phosphatase-like protein, partial [Ephemerocybe angulata]